MRLLMFSGKGGVGKTTCAAASAVYYAQFGQRTLLFSTDPAHSLADSLEIKTNQGTQPIRVTANLDMVELKAEQVLSELKQEYHHEIIDLITAGTYLDEDDARRLISLTIPGIDEIMGLKTILDFIENQTYDIYIWDTAPSGHTLRLLALPDELDCWIKAIAQVRWKYRQVMTQLARQQITGIKDDLLFNLKKAIQKVRKVMMDSEQCIFTAVTIPESMAVEETIRLKSSLQHSGINVSKLIVNNIAPSDSACSFCQGRYRQQQISVKQIQKEFQACQILSVPQFSREVKGLANLTKFARYLFPTTVEVKV